MGTLDYLFGRSSRRRALYKFAALGVVLGFLLLFLGQGQEAYAAIITVNTSDDELNSDGDCSLREAIQAANTDAAIDACTAGSGVDTITVPAGTYILSIAGIGEDMNASGDLDILDSLSITGAGVGSTIINGNSIDRVFEVFAGATVDFSDVTITGGNISGNGGGIYSAGSLTLTNSTVSGNASGDSGGGISSAVSLTLTNSTVSGNMSADAGGIDSEVSATLTNVTISGNMAEDTGGIRTRGAMTLTNSTVSGNTADTGGAFTVGGSLTLTNSTVSGNTGNDNAAAFENHGTITLNNSTVTNNTAGRDQGGINGNTILKNTIVANNIPDDCSGTNITSAGHNLIEDTSLCTIGGDTTGNIIGVDSLLGPLADNGGSTQTHALLAGSPAIDAGSNDCPPPTTDQRGVARSQGAACDIGAFELIQNKPPTADVGGPYTFAEGNSDQLDGSESSDPDPDDTLTYEWDLDYNGVTFDVDMTGVQPQVSFPDNFPARTIALRVTDSGGLSDIATTSLEVTNVAPIASFANTSGTIIEGESATVEFSNQFDPSSVDTASGFAYSYDCDGDGTFEQVDISTPSSTCDYPDSGTFTAKGRIKDKDESFTDYTVEVIVQTPQEATESIIEDVEDLVNNGSLNNGQGNSLISKLENIIDRIDEGNTNAAINQLQAFISQVNDLINEGVLSPVEGQPLIDAVIEIIAAVSS